MMSRRTRRNVLGALSAVFGIAAFLVRSSTLLGLAPSSATRIPGLLLGLSAIGLSVAAFSTLKRGGQR